MASGKVVSAVLQYWSGSSFDNDQRYTYTYNAFDQMKALRTASWDGSAWANTTSDEIYTMEYEEYNQIATGVNTVNADFNVSIFPNPATDALTIAINTIEPGTSVISLYDIRGAVLTTSAETISNDFVKTISTRNIPSGSYFLNIEGAQNRVTKQITIQH